MPIDVNVNFPNIGELSAKLDLIVASQQMMQIKIDKLSDELESIIRPRAVLTLGKSEDKPSK